MNMITRRCLLVLLFTICLNAQSTIVIRHPHYPIRSRNSYVSWDVVSGLSNSYTYPEHNVTAFPSYEFFVNEINFDDAGNGNFFIGAKNHLYEMSTNNLTVIRKHYWPASMQNITFCEAESIDDSFACHNHIRVYKKLPQNGADDRLYCCGTGAYTPKCRTLDINNINSSSGASDPVSTNDVGVLSVHPAIPALWTFQEDNPNKLLATGFYRANMWNEYDFARYNVSYNTSTRQLDVASPADRSIVSTNDFHIREPYHPLRVYKVDLNPGSGNNNYKMYLFFFREREFAAQDSTVASVKSRVIRICENDNYVSGGFFSSLLKAEMFCTKKALGTPESFGAQIYYYTALRDAALSTTKSRWYGNSEIWQELLYAIFTGEQYAPNGTAICVYYSGIVDITSTSTFLDNHRGVFEVFNQNVFSSESGDTQSSGSFLNCQTANDRSQKKDFLAANPIQQFRGLTLPILEMEGEVFKKIAIDTTCVMQSHNHTCLMQDVIIVGNEKGKIYKFAFTTKRTDYPEMPNTGLSINDLTYDAVIAQEWELADSNGIEQLYLRNENKVTYIYATTYSRIYKFPVAYCSRHGSCKDCIGSRDPHCFWNDTAKACETYTHSENGSLAYDVPQNLYQNITGGEHSVCNSGPECNNLNITSDSANGFYITGSDSCTGTNSRSLTVSPHGCHGESLSFTLNGNSEQSVNSSSIVGRRFYNLTYTAQGPGGTEAYVFYAWTVNGAPSTPTSSEVTHVPNTDNVQVIVALDGCSLHSDPQDHRICVRFDNGDETCQDYYGINIFTSPNLAAQCYTVSYTLTVVNSYGSSLPYVNSITALSRSPSPPTNLNSIDSTESTISISWTKPTNTCSIIGYSLYINNVKRLDCSVTDTQLQMTGLFAYTNYFVGVSSCSTGGESTPTNQTFRTRCGRPGQVANLKSVSSNSPQMLTFSWDAPFYNGSNLVYTVFEECFYRTNIGESVSITSATTHNIPYLEPRSQCCITVTANSTCESVSYEGYEATICDTTMDDIPDTVQNLTATSLSPNSVLLKWNPPSNYRAPGLTYNITVAKPNQEVFFSEEVNNQLHIFLLELEQNTNYNITVLPHNDVGEGDAVILNITTLPDVPQPPVNVTLSFSECNINVQWEDRNRTTYNVTSYRVLAQCDEMINRMTVDTSSAIINICTNGVTPGLAWCSVQVIGINSIGQSRASEAATAVYPSSVSVPSRPNCYLTDDKGNEVTFSFVATAPYALDDNLYVNYSLTSTIRNEMDMNEIPFTDNTLVLNTSRNTQYSLKLRLCDRNPDVANTQDKCGEPCQLDFVSSSILPGSPVNVDIYGVIHNGFTVSWERPPNETTTLEYELSVRGAGEGNANYRTNSTEYVVTNVSPNVTYTVSARTIDLQANVSSVYTNPLSVTTPDGIPGIVKRLDGNLIDSDTDNGNDTLDIFWEPPEIYNGTITQYTIVWSIDQNGDCMSFDDDQLMENAGYTIDYVPHGNFSRSYSVFKRSGDFKIVLCAAASTSAGRGQWKNSVVDVTASGITERQQQAATTALTVVTIITILAIAAAVMIAIILLIVCYKGHRNHSKQPLVVPGRNGGVGNTPVQRKHWKDKLRRTPNRKQTESVKEFVSRNGNGTEEP